MWKWRNKRSQKDQMIKDDHKLRYEQIATIPLNTHVEGDIYTKDNLRIDGKVKGKIDSQAHVVVGARAIVHGNIKCKTLIVMGEVNGNCLVLEHAHLVNKSVVYGNIFTRQIEIDKESKLSGTYKLMEKEIAPS